MRIPFGLMSIQPATIADRMMMIFAAMESARRTEKWQWDI